MEKIKSLFIIFLLFIFISLVMGAGVAFISTTYAAVITGVSLIASSLFILSIFAYEFKPVAKSGDKS